MNNTTTVIKLKNQVATQIIKIDTWNQINQELEWKKQKVTGSRIRYNPFE